MTIPAKPLTREDAERITALYKRLDDLRTEGHHVAHAQHIVIEFRRTADGIPHRVFIGSEDPRFIPTRRDFADGITKEIAATVEALNKLGFTEAKK